MNDSLDMDEFMHSIIDVYNKFHNDDNDSETEKSVTINLIKTRERLALGAIKQVRKVRIISDVIRLICAILILLTIPRHHLLLLRISIGIAITAALFTTIYFLITRHHIKNIKKYLIYDLAELYYYVVYLNNCDKDLVHAYEKLAEVYYTLLEI